MTKSSTRGEMDITTVFGTVIPGSSPGGCTKTKNQIFVVILQYLILLFHNLISGYGLVVK